MSVLILIVTFTATYLVWIEAHDLDQLTAVRELTANWILCDGIQQTYSLWHDSFDKDREAFQLPVSLRKGNYIKYYLGFGRVSIKADLSTYTITVANPLKDSDMKPWSRTMPSVSLDPVFASPSDSSFFLNLAGNLAAVDIIDPARTDAISANLWNYLDKLAVEQLTAPSGSSKSKKTLVHTLQSFKREDDLRWSFLSINKSEDQLELVYYFQPQGIDYSGKDNPLIAYRKFERLILWSETKVPVLNFDMSRSLAFWVLLLINLILCVLLQEEMIRPQGAPRGRLEEPWIVIDATSTMGRIIGRSWGLLLLVAPVVLAACLYLHLTYQFGAGVIAAEEYGLSLPIAAIALVLGVSASAGSYKLLRRLRKQVSKRIARSKSFKKTGDPA